MKPLVGDASYRGAVGAAPGNWLRLEGVAVLSLALFLYARGSNSWLLFAALILVPDVGIAGYIAGPRVGAMTYNAFHSYVAPLVLAALGMMTDRLHAIPLIWIAHIGIDRALGLGLKYPTGCRDTHLGQIGKPPREVE